MLEENLSLSANEYYIDGAFEISHTDTWLVTCKRDHNYTEIFSFVKNYLKGKLLLIDNRGSMGIDPQSEDYDLNDHFIILDETNGKRYNVVFTYTKDEEGVVIRVFSDTERSNGILKSSTSRHGSAGNWMMTNVTMGCQIASMLNDLSKAI